MANIFDELAGLPAHPLAVHAPVILIPLAALTALLYAFLPRARSSVRWWLGGLTLAATATAWFATKTGSGCKMNRRRAAGHYLGRNSYMASFLAS